MKEKDASSPQTQETASLVKRLAGPSTGKAGLAQDQTEINRIIAEASKGSKFYENEKRKDKDLTLRIEKIVRERDIALEGVNIELVEKLADHLLATLEHHRDLTQIIVHIDMDAFYASVELLDNPDLEGKPFGVGRGVLTTASYEARKYGVRSGMPTFIAKKLCPDLIIVPNNFSKYMEKSNVVMAILRRYDPEMLAAGCDEAYLNVTSYCKSHKLMAEDCVRQMRESVYTETKLTASAGIASNKMLAKICSDKNKPNGQFQLSFDTDSILSFLHNMSIRKIPGIGRVNERLLESLGIRTCGDIYTNRALIYLMDRQLGRQYLFTRYLGISSNIVRPAERSERKSIGAERTFSPIDNKDKILEKLKSIAIELEKDMKQNQWTGRTITLKYKLDTYQVFTRSKSFDGYVRNMEELYQAGKELLLPDLPLSIRLIGLRVTKLKDLKSPLPSNGIKRFFEPLSSEMPAKRVKTIDNPDEDVDSFVHSDDMDEVMPGFHEDDESDALQDVNSDHYDGQELAPLAVAASKPRPPHSAPVPATGHGRPAPKSIKPSASNHKKWTANANALIASVETHCCPICRKTMHTDNQGLNSHIDFCLSRDTIRQAHAEASTGFGFSSSRKPVSEAKRKRSI